MTKLRFVCDDVKHEDQLKLFDIIIKHKQLEQIIIDDILFNYNNINENIATFDWINNLKNTKPNAKISVWIRFSKDYFINNCHQILNEYKQSFERSNWKVQLDDFVGCKRLFLKLIFYVSVKEITYFLLIN